MTNDTQQRVAPLQIAGHDIEVRLTADHFYLWGFQARRAFELIRSDPQQAAGLIKDVADEMDRFYVAAREHASASGK